MTPPPDAYTYRAGEKLELDKRPGEFVARVLPADAAEHGFDEMEQVSSASTRVKVAPADLEGAMSEMRAIAPTHHAYDVAGTGAEFLISDRVLVTFREDIRPEEVDAFAGEYGLVPVERYTERDYLFQLTDHTGMNPVKLVVKLTESDARVESADNDVNYRAEKYQDVALPRDPSYPSQWHLHTHLSDPDFDPRASARCEDAWRLLHGYGDPEVVIGITDDGCKLDHEDFNGPQKFAGWGYFVGNRLVTRGEVDADPAQMYEPGENHGTSCAGIAAGEADAKLTVGAAPNCKLLPIKWELSGGFLLISDSKLLTALAYLGDRVDVLSSSWGSVPVSLRAAAVVRKVEELGKGGGRRKSGIVFVWAAGNENCPLRYQGPTAIPFTSGWRPASTPGGSPVWEGVRTATRFENNLVGLPGVMHVAALSSTAQRSHYSNYGEGITLCAPTSNSHKYGRLTVRGLRVTTASGGAGGVTSAFGGTSSATPLTAGVAALVISAAPTLSAYDTISILKRTASRDLSDAGYPRTPASGYDPDPAWDVSPVAPADFAQVGDADGSWSPWFGFGRIDAAAAVTAARGTGGTGTTGLRFESRPRRTIPDNDPAGLEDRIAVREAGRLAQITVEVDITHSYIGDLLVTLVAPDGTAVDLHHRAEGSEDDLRRSYDLSTLSALAALRGKPISGAWALRVKDLARLDIGTLNRWAIALGVDAEPLSLADAGSVGIPDGDPRGIVRSIRVPVGRIASAIAVSVDITHPWVPDLQLTLVPPRGQPIRLFQRGGSRDLAQTWRSEDTPELEALRGLDLGGEWKLQVADWVRRDQGRLNRWSIELA